MSIITCVAPDYTNSPAKCSVEDESHSSGYLRHGMCEKHYWRSKTYGTPKPEHISACTCCGKQFTSTSRGKKYCSRVCVDRGKPSVSGLTCYICNDPMVKGRTSKPQGEAAHNKCRAQRGGGHGRTGYDYGCRCEVCTEAKRVATAEYVAKVKSRDGVSPSAQRRRQAQGLDPLQIIDCYMCNERLTNVRSNTARYPLHKACRKTAPEWMRRGWDDPTEERAAALATRQAKSAEIEAKKLAKANTDQRSDLRAGYEDGDYCRFLRGLRVKSTVSANGCWEWQGKLNRNKATSSGYPTIAFAGRSMQVHRLVIEAREGKPLGVLAAHHMCANSACVNPDHLQPVTQRENVAEMLARTSLEARIQELEAALRAAAPNHPALNRVSHLRVA